MLLPIAVCILLCAIIISPACALQRFESRGITVIASTIEGCAQNDGSYKVIADKNACLKMLNQAAGTSFEAQSDKVTMIIGQTAVSKGSMKSAELCGNVSLTYTTCDPATGNRTTSTATADSAAYDGIEQKAYLVGNIRIVNNNPAIFEGPAVMTGDKATINLKPATGPEFKVESSPGLSSIEATPKKQEAAQSK